MELSVGHKMNYLSCKVRLFPVICVYIVFQQYIYAADYKIAKTPNWVKSVSIPVPSGQNKKNYSNGVNYLLVDNQSRLLGNKQTIFKRYVQKAVNVTGVKKISQVSIDFDPLYESVKLHKLVIHRDGQAMNMLGRAKYNVLHREREREYQIYDGTKTLDVIVEDVRAGDSIEYSFSIDGSNPALAGHFSQYMPLQWGVAVERIYYRVLWPSARPVYINNYKTSIKPQIALHDKSKEYIWSVERAAKLVRDKNTPGWYDPFKAVQLSDMSDWKQVVDWALPLYKPEKNTSLLKQAVASITKKTRNREQRILLSLKFVQNEIRYLASRWVADPIDPIRRTRCLISDLVIARINHGCW